MRRSTRRSQRDRCDRRAETGKNEKRNKRRWERQTVDYLKYGERLLAWQLFQQVRVGDELAIMDVDVQRGWRSNACKPHQPSHI